METRVPYCTPVTKMSAKKKKKSLVLIGIVIPNRSATSCTPSGVSNFYSTMLTAYLIAFEHSGADWSVLMKISKSKVLKSSIAWMTPDEDHEPKA